MIASNMIASNMIKFKYCQTGTLLKILAIIQMQDALRASFHSSLLASNIKNYVYFFTPNFENQKIFLSLLNKAERNWMGCGVKEHAKTQFLYYFLQFGMT